MELMQSQVELLIDCSSSILDNALRMRNILEQRYSYWNDALTTPEEILRRRQDALIRYRAKYGGVDTDVHRAEVHQKQQEQLPIESWHTLYPKRRLEFEMEHGLIKDEELYVTPPVEDVIDMDTQGEPLEKRQKLV